MACARLCWEAPPRPGACGAVGRPPEAVGHAVPAAARLGGRGGHRRGRRRAPPSPRPLEVPVTPAAVDRAVRAAARFVRGPPASRARSRPSGSSGGRGAIGAADRRRHGAGGALDAHAWLECADGTVVGPGRRSIGRFRCSCGWRVPGAEARRRGGDVGSRDAAAPASHVGFPGARPAPRGVAARVGRAHDRPPAGRSRAVRRPRAPDGGGLGRGRGFAPARGDRRGGGGGSPSRRPLPPRGVPSRRRDVGPPGPAARRDRAGARGPGHRRPGVQGADARASAVRPAVAAGLGGSRRPRAAGAFEAAGRCSPGSGTATWWGSRRRCAAWRSAPTGPGPS
jgi:hypothetical protein